MAQDDWAIRLVLQLLEHIRSEQKSLSKKVRHLMSDTKATQADIDALTAKVTTDESTLAAFVTSLLAEIAVLESAGVDVTGLKNAVALLDADAAAVPPVVEPPVDPPVVDPPVDPPVVDPNA